MLMLMLMLLLFSIAVVDVAFHRRLVVSTQPIHRVDCVDLCFSKARHPAGLEPLLAGSSSSDLMAKDKRGCSPLMLAAAAGSAAAVQAILAAGERCKDPRPHDLLELTVLCPLFSTPRDDSCKREDLRSRFEA